MGIFCDNGMIQLNCLVHGIAHAKALMDSPQPFARFSSSRRPNDWPRLYSETTSSVKARKAVRISEYPSRTIWSSMRWMSRLTLSYIMDSAPVALDLENNGLRAA